MFRWNQRFLPVTVGLAFCILLFLIAYAVAFNTQTTPRALAATLQVTITDAGFDPATITVPPGTEVTWRNATSHTLTLVNNISATVYLPSLQGPQSKAIVGQTSVNSVQPQSANASGDSFKQTLAPNATFEHIFTTAGEQHVSILENPALIGIIIIQIGTGGQVHGYVTTDFKEQPAGAIVGTGFAHIPDVQVFLKTSPGGITVLGSQATTNPHGYFVIPTQLPGKYQVCAEGNGFVSTCEGSVITIKSGVVVLDHDIKISPKPGFLQGQVLLKDGRACYEESQMFGVLNRAKITLENAVGTVLAGPVLDNSLGQYVLPKIPGPGAYKLVVECGAANLSTPINPTSSDLLGVTPFNLTLGNSSPRIALMIPSMGGKEVRRAEPNDVVNVQLTAQDPDGDPLHYEWVDQSSGPISATTSSISWTLSTQPTNNILFVHVTDGKGGFATQYVSLPTGEKGDFFSGIVVDKLTKAPIGGAIVKVNDTPITSAPNGYFQLTVDEADRFVLNVRKPQYALLSQILYMGTTDLILELDQAHRASCNPAKPCRALDESKQTLASVEIPANALVDDNGNPATTTLTIDIHGYDLNEPNAIPGDYGALDKDGKAFTMQSYGALDVQITDAAGNHYNLASGQNAKVSIGVDSGIVAAASPPPTLVLWEYDEKTGYWRQKADATYDSGTHAYVGDVPSFSAWNADSVFSNTACIAVQIHDVDPTHLAPPLPIRLTGDIPSTPGLFRHPDFTVTSAPFPIYRLPPNTAVSITVHTNSGPDFPVPPVFVVNSGAPIDPLYEASPFDGVPPLYALQSACHGSLTIALPVPNHDAPYLSVPSEPCDIRTSACDAETVAYYKAIGALDSGGNPTAARGNFNAWKTTNHLSTDPLTPAAGEVRAVYYNNGDLQFGRDMHCKQTGSDVACYVTNFSATGGPGGPDQAAIQLAENNLTPIASVAMEYNHSLGATGVRFYVYHADLPNNNGTLFKNPLLDSEGNKYAPFICMACHGGAYDTAIHNVNNAAFLAFDTPTFKQDLNPASIFSEPNQVDAFRQLNALVVATHPNSTNANDPITNLINGWYSWCGGLGAGGCAIDDSVAHRYVPPPPAPGWPGKADLYQTIPREYCRTCHVAQGSSSSPYPDWTQFSVFNSPGFIGSVVCTVHSMPHAEVPFKKFWLSTDPHGPAYLANSATGINIPGGCPP